MISLSFTKKDLVRVAWTFAAAAVASWATTGGSYTKAAAIAAVAAGITAVKNFVLADGLLKG